MDQDYNGRDGLSALTEDELDRKPEYFTQLARLEFFGTDPEDLLEADDSGLLNQYEDNPEKVEQDFRRLLATARRGELPEGYQERFAGAIAEKRAERREVIYDVADIEYDFDFQQEFEEIKEDLLNRLWS